jgi:tetratricopeptide (TPR) repeat protein
MVNNKTLTINESFNLAVKNHQEGKIDVAQELYNQVLKIDPNFVNAHNNLGVILQELGELQKAKGCYEKTIEIDPSYVKAHNNLGVIFKELGDKQKAKNCYEKAIEIDPNYTDAHNNLGTIFQDLGELQKAKECFEKAIEIDPGYVKVRNNLGVTLQELGELQKAKKCYEKAIEIDPNYANSYYNLGVLFKELGEFEKVKECYEKAIEIDPNYADAYNNLGVIFKELGEFEKAKKCFKKVIEIDPNYANAQDNLGFFLDKQRVLSEIEKAQKSKNKNQINFIKKIRKKIFGTDLRLKTNPFISYRAVEEELISCLYKMENNNKRFEENNNNLFFGNVKFSEIKIFQKNFSILKKVENELTIIIKQAVKSDIFILDSFYNIFKDSNKCGIKWHTHLDDWDTSHGLQHQKYSLQYYLSMGDQTCSEPGIFKMSDPAKEILPSKGMITIIPANRKHAAVYNGEIDRVMLGINFYSLI